MSSQRIPDVKKVRRRLSPHDSWVYYDLLYILVLLDLIGREDAEELKREKLEIILGG